MDEENTAWIPLADSVNLSEVDRKWLDEYPFVWCINADNAQIVKMHSGVTYKKACFTSMETAILAKLRWSQPIK